MPVVPRQQLDDGAAGLGESLGEVGVRVEEPEHPGLLAGRDQVRRHGQACPFDTGAGRPEADRASDATPEAAYRVGLGVAEGVLGVDRHAWQPRTRSRWDTRLTGYP